MVTVLVWVLLIVALGLTATMYATRRATLGFPCGIFWALAGAASYSVAVYDWDIYFTVGIACLIGMLPFSIFVAFGLREKRDTIGDIEMEGDEGTYLDEASERSPRLLLGMGKGRQQREEEENYGGMFDMDGEGPTRRAIALRERAVARREPRTKPKRKKESWGEFG